MFIGPILPLSPEHITDMITGIAGSVLIDRLNYPKKVVSIYRRSGLEDCLRESYFHKMGSELKEKLEKRDIPVSLLFT